jgi:FkbM family methyltransferase
MNRQLRALIKASSCSLEKSQIGRLALLTAARLAARLVTKRSIGFRRIGNCWFRVDGGATLPVGTTLELNRGGMMSWEEGGEEMSRPRRDWWFRYYSPSPGDIVLDVGAGRGEDVLVFSKAVGNAGRVVAVEAHPATFDILRAFVRLNRLGNVHLENCAVCDKRGTVLMACGTEEHWQCAAIVRSGGNGIPVPATRIDDLPQLARAPRVAFVKMNIEGAEVEALRGAGETLAKTDRICVCCHDFLSMQTRTKAAVKAILTRHGFRLFSAPPGAPPYENDFVYGTR